MPVNSGMYVCTAQEKESGGRPTKDIGRGAHPLATTECEMVASDSPSNVVDQPRQQRVSEDERGAHPDLMTPNPALTGFARHLPTFHDRPYPRAASLRPPAQRARLGRAFRHRRRVRIRQDFPRTGINPVLFHPLPILLVQLWPFRSKFEPSIAGFHVVDSLGRRCDARRESRVRSTTGRVPPPGSRSQHATLRFGRADTTRRHLLAAHERHQPDQDRRHFPRRIEGLGMEIADAETQPRRRLEPSARGVHPNRRRRKRILGREY